MSTGGNYLKWKQRAEQAEATVDALKSEVHGLMNSRGDWQARAEHAEKERDAARESADDWKTCYEHAEADNAALLEAYRRTWGCVMHDNVLHSPACNDRADGRGDCLPECPALYVSVLLKTDHPGAALLERLRALVDGGIVERNGDRVTLNVSASAYDALKERTP